MSTRKGKPVSVIARALVDEIFDEQHGHDALLRWASSHMLIAIGMALAGAELPDEDLPRIEVRIGLESDRRLQVVSRQWRANRLKFAGLVLGWAVKDGEFCKRLGL